MLALLSLFLVAAQAWDEAIDSDFEAALFEGLAAEDCFGSSAADRPECALSLLQTSVTLTKRSAVPLPDDIKLHNQTDVKLPGILTPDAPEEIPPWSVATGGRKDGDLPAAAVAGQEAEVFAHDNTTQQDSAEGLSLFQATAFMHRIARENQKADIADPEIDEEDIVPVSLLQTGLQLKATAAEHRVDIEATKQQHMKDIDILGVFDDEL